MVHVAGTGVISSIGNSYSECLESLQQQRHGIKPLTSIESVHKGLLPVGEAGISNTDLTEQLGLKHPSLSRTILLGLCAANEALRSSGLTTANKWRTGFISATTVGGMDKTEIFFPEFLTDPSKGRRSEVVHHACGSTTEVMADYLGVTDFISTINTACSSSVNSITLGARLIKSGKLDVVIAGGTDALTRFTINGFKSLMILDDDLCRPFDAARKGLNLGEGAGYVVLVSEQVLEEAHLTSLAIVSGYANTNDAYHQTASSPEGRGSFDAMRGALLMAGLAGEDIDYINLHGTGTLNNDLSEGTALRRIFSDRIPAVSSTKSFTGHTLGACGGIEAVFSVMALNEQCVFPNLRFESVIPEINIYPQAVFEKKEIAHVMSNSFGFGGNCSSVIFSKPV